MSLSTGTVQEQFEISSKNTLYLIQKTVSAHQYTLSNCSNKDNRKVSQLVYPQKINLREMVWLQKT